MRLIQNFLHGQQLGDSAGSLVERGALSFGVFAVAKADEKAAA